MAAVDVTSTYAVTGAGQAPAVGPLRTGSSSIRTPSARSRISVS